MEKQSDRTKHPTAPKSICFCIRNSISFGCNYIFDNKVLDSCSTYIIRSNNRTIKLINMMERFFLYLMRVSTNIIFELRFQESWTIEFIRDYKINVNHRGLTWCFVCRILHQVCMFRSRSLFFSASILWIFVISKMNTNV